MFPTFQIIQKHPYLKRKEIMPPFVPTFRDHRAADDATYFDREFTKRAPRDSPAVAASAGAQDVFRGFSYSAQSTMGKFGNLKKYTFYLKQ